MNSESSPTLYKKKERTRGRIIIIHDLLPPPSWFRCVCDHTTTFGYLLWPNRRKLSISYVCILRKVCFRNFPSTAGFSEPLSRHSAFPERRVFPRGDSDAWCNAKLFLCLCLLRFFFGIKRRKKTLSSIEAVQTCWRLWVILVKTERMLLLCWKNKNACSCTWNNTILLVITFENWSLRWILYNQNICRYCFVNFFYIIYARNCYSVKWLNLWLIMWTHNKFIKIISYN